MAKKTIYRAVVISGIIHGGGGTQTGEWKRSYLAANRELATILAHYDDSFSCVEALQMDELKAKEILRTQGR